MNTLVVVLCLLAGDPPLAKAETENCLIRVAEAQIDEVPLKNPITKAAGLSAEKHLIVLLVVSNLSDTKKVDYQGAGSNMFMSHATMRDDLGNSYKAVTFGVNEIALQKRDVSIYPGKSVSDLYVFEPPVQAAKTLILTIEGRSFGNNKNVELTFPIPRAKKDADNPQQKAKAAADEAAAKRVAELEAKKRTTREARLADREGLAATKLKLVKALMAANPEKAKKRLTEITEEYSDTAAAKEAEELLEKLE